MRSRSLLASLITSLVLASTARAEERATTVVVGGLGGVLTSDTKDGGTVPDRGFGGIRLILGWDRPALAYPAQPGYALDGTLVPELIAGALLDEDRGEGMIGVGLRAELRMSQKERGLLRISARGAFYLVGRAMVIGADRDPIGELGFGEYLLFGEAGRIGFEVCGVARGGQASGGGGLVHFFVGWSLR
ncbi:MAG: hypothetical protein ACTHU0_08275 [Kofleriaceae bacterium]